MTGTDFICLMPFLILSGAPVAMMITIAFKRNFTVIYLFSILAFILAIFSLFSLPAEVPQKISTLLIIDGYSILLFGIILFASLAVSVLSHDFLLYQESEKEEYLIMLFPATLGSLLLVAACNFVTLFLGLEMLSISLYVLIAYRRAKDHAIEAGIKYMVLAAVSSAFLLFGMGLIFADTGTLEFTRLSFVLRTPFLQQPLLLAGFAMMFVGMGFKLAAVPFHMWTPDVYQGAPTPVTIFIATVSKGAVLAVVLRFFYAIDGFREVNFSMVITLIALFSMFVGNLLALRQNNIKRMLAYSSIANMGYMLTTLLVGDENGFYAAIFYIMAYTITTVGAFGVVLLLSDRHHEAEQLSDYRGLFWKRPWPALVMTLSMLSLAGIPLTAGFMGKFYIVFTGINNQLWILVISLIINSVIGLAYYLRVVSTLFAPAGEQQFPVMPIRGHIVLGLVVIGILWLGLNPGGVFDLITRISGIE